jgi:SAM-dependent methyltransferase
MERVPEPELMLDAAQARAYAAADFAAPHQRCIELLLEKQVQLPAAGRAVDLGCGPGDVTLRLARALPGWSIDALDGSPAMLALAREACTRAGVQARVSCCAVVLPHGRPPHPPYDLLFSNSLLHHLASPMVLWSALAGWGRAGAGVFVMDLLRPRDETAVRRLVGRYAAGEPPVLRRDFDASLRAAYRPAEVREQLRQAGLADLQVEVVSDRHFIVWGRLGPMSAVASR